MNVGNCNHKKRELKTLEKKKSIINAYLDGVKPQLIEKQCKVTKELV
jgi:hypothetical protein